MNYGFGGWSIEKGLFDYIRSFLDDGKTILEFGSGFGTQHLVNFYGVISIEDKKQWVGKYGSHYIYAPARDYDGYSWYDVDIIKRELEGMSYDIILVDGPSSPPGRQGLIHHLNLFNTEVPMIFDDVHRQKDRDLGKSVAKILNRNYTIHRGGQKEFMVL